MRIFRILETKPLAQLLVGLVLVGDNRVYLVDLPRETR